MEGVHPKLVSERAGHANVNITRIVYAACLPGVADEAAKGIDQWFTERRVA
jgi:integrase